LPHPTAPPAAPPPSSDGTVIVGAGPAGLALATLLRCHDLGPVEVIDPSGRWLTTWHDRFAAQAIAHLRSPAVHHPHPDPFALLATAGPTDLVRSGQANLPTTAAFARFTSALVDAAGLADAVTAASVTSLQLLDDGDALLHLSDGTSRRPARVVLATNRRTPSAPAVVGDALRQHPAVRVGDACDVRNTPEAGHVIVVGGGLSAAQLCSGAAARGARVTLVTRRRITVRRYDTHPTWLGPRKLRPFSAEPDPAVRHRMLTQARGGGSMPHRARVELERLESTGQLQLRERAELTDVQRVGDGLRVCIDGHETIPADELWCATGGQVDVHADPLLSDLRTRHPLAIAGGLPDLDAALRWPGTNVHLSGAAAGLILGPTAGNLIGHRRAAQRITAALRGLDPDRADRITTGTGACPQLGFWPTPSAAAATRPSRRTGVANRPSGHAGHTAHQRKPTPAGRT